MTGSCGRRSVLGWAALAAGAPSLVARAASGGDALMLRGIIASPSRPAADRARDRWRHPYASLRFWGLRPGMTIIDLQPGSGYWTRILAPYAARTGGTYIAGLGDMGAARTRFDGLFSDVAHYGHIRDVSFGPNSGPLADPGSVDLILTAREIHNWIGGGYLDHAMGVVDAALKPGGILAVEEHRADPVPQEAGAASGYVAVSTVVQAATRAGLQLDASSEINANPRDDKKHPFGVWTLPPTRASSASGQPDPSFDHTTYDAIGESDRMTLRFRKPA
ncbi:class I SAM-dependent methyltransferase [Gluconacetobacter tumulisoli]|uniref:Class I SAM-dependent methyltransferase n=1 Tax=Gluconacetobacter tumulisoli TaxID=1286189 RepID=A0A7W4K691_9PROT|nr:class I SAM-dependent methyltransferase [Gluconacetobacter tumulisoli]MBB2201163.1 class I SAM-dependent methyltransferase [Gluconacetobacter tumulisoli]